LLFSGGKECGSEIYTDELELAVGKLAAEVAEPETYILESVGFGGTCALLAVGSELTVGATSV